MKTKRQRGMESVQSRVNTEKWESLTWDDVASWAGDRSLARGRTYHRQRRVHDLAVSDEGRLLATVAGGDRYTVSVWWEADSLRSRCTCPVGWDGCKHAVATVAAYLEHLEQGATIPAAGADDSRWAELTNAGAESEFDAAEEDDAVEIRRARNRRSSASAEDEMIRQYIATREPNDLPELLWSLVERFPEVREELRERIALGEGDVNRLVAVARKELRRVASTPGWWSNWTGEGFTPDYSRLRHRLERMVELGHPDAVVQLGKEIIAGGMDQIGQSDDEGETTSAFAECLPVIFLAVTQSSLQPARKILFAIDAHLADDYGLMEQPGVDVVLEECKFQPSDWSAAADALVRRLKPEPRIEDDFQSRFERDRVCSWLIRALRNAGRDEEVLVLCEREARVTGSYARLVALLIEQKQYDQAEQWATEGIRVNAGRYAGIGTQLAHAMEEVARLRRRWKIVAGHAAVEFFDRPGTESFGKLTAAAERAGCRDTVQQLALGFLKTGKSPISIVAGRDGNRCVTLAQEWPLPIPDYLLPLLRANNGAPECPHYDVLIDMAIAENHPDDTLRWYDKWHADTRPPRSAWSYAPAKYVDRIAEAVAASQPERALEIYRRSVDANLTRADISAYQNVAEYLRKMRPILKSLDREWEWKEILADIRLRYHNRPRFMTILDGLDAKPILRRRHERH